MTYPVAMIPYVNMAPYRESGCPDGCRFVSMVPSASVEALRSGTVLAAALPVAALPALGEIVLPVGRFGIAAREASLSVLVFSDRPFDALGPADAVAATRESTTSVQLLRVLLEEAASSASDGNGRGRLVIGDRALSALHRWRGGERPAPGDGDLLDYGHVTDLASEWHRRVGLPFVFARWVIRRDAPRECRRAVEEWLARFREDEARWVRRAVPGAMRQTGLPRERIHRYFQVIRRCLTPEDTAGQERFLRCLEPLAPAFHSQRPQRSATAA